MSLIPEAKLLRNELTLRDLSLPEEVLLARKSLIRWTALSLGLISPNESRRLLLDILDVLLGFHVAKEAPTTSQIIDKLIEQGGDRKNTKAVYYHLLKLKEKELLVRKKGRYYLWGEDWKSLPELFRDFYFKKAENMFEKIGVALKKLENGYKK